MVGSSLLSNLFLQASQSSLVNVPLESVKLVPELTVLTASLTHAVSQDIGLSKLFIEETASSLLPAALPSRGVASQVSHLW